MSKLSDCWRTPDWLFKQLSEEHGPFDIDLCATAENSKCNRFCKDYLNVERGGAIRVLAQNNTVKTCFMNPPYSNPLPFIEKAWEDSKHCKIVCLLKCDPSTKWWATFWNYDDVINCKHCYGKGFTNNGYLGIPKIYCTECQNTGKTTYNGPKPGCQVFFLPKRVRFDPPIGYTGKVGSPSFPSAIVVMDRRKL